MEHKIMKSELWKEIKVIDVNIKTTSGKQITVPGAVLRNLAVTPCGMAFSITHVNTGYAIVKDYLNAGQALLGMVLYYHTLGNMDDPFTTSKAEDVPGNKTAKKVYQFIKRHMQVWNNSETEDMVGVFYADREECERLRWEINPDCKQEYLDEYASISPKAIEHDIIDYIINREEER